MIFNLSLGKLVADEPKVKPNDLNASKLVRNICFDNVDIHNMSYGGIRIFNAYSFESPMPERALPRGGGRTRAVARGFSRGCVGPSR